MITIRSGKYKNKKLAIPENGVRPTSDKIRQAIFNILAHNPFDFTLRDARVLDAFAGTGAMGLEALSRGAVQAWFMEKDSAAGSVLKENLKIAGQQAVMLRADAAAPPPPPGAMNLIFLDPPYDEGLLSRAMSALRAGGWIDDKTLCVCECDAIEPIALPEHFTIIDERKYGRTKILFVSSRASMPKACADPGSRDI